MQERISARLESLKKEYEAGRRLLADLDAQQVELQRTLLSIGGAIQVLEELLGTDQPAGTSGVGEPRPVPSTQPGTRPADPSPTDRAATV
jgi:hypothetical protein